MYIEFLCLQFFLCNDGSRFLTNKRNVIIVGIAVDKQELLMSIFFTHGTTVYCICNKPKTFLFGFHYQVSTRLIKQFKQTYNVIDLNKVIVRLIMNCK